MELLFPEGLKAGETDAVIDMEDSSGQGCPVRSEATLVSVSSSTLFILNALAQTMVKWHLRQ